MGDKHRILVRNETDIDLASHDCSLSLRLPDGSGRGTSTALPARSTVDLTHHRGYTLALRRHGFVFRGAVQVRDDPALVDSGVYDPDQGKPRVVLDPPGSIFCVIEDPNNRAVTKDDVAAAHELIVSCLELGGRVPTPFRDTTSDCWTWIATQLGRREDEAQSLKAELRSQLARGDLRQPWHALYDARRPALPAGMTNAAKLEELVNTRRVGLVVYFRALDRFPGGNADWAVLKFKLGFHPPLPKNEDEGKNEDDEKSEAKCEDEKSWVRWMGYRNWDGTGTISRRSVEREKLPVAQVRAQLLEPLADLIDASEQRSVETVVVDRHLESEGTNTEWSSVEVLVYVPPELADDVGVTAAADTPDDASVEPFAVAETGDQQKPKPWPLAFRLHQRAVPHSSSSSQRPTNVTTGRAKAVLNGASSLFRVGRVSSTLRHVELEERARLHDFTDIYLPPLFLQRDEAMSIISS